MRVAVVTDLHGNRTAFDAVLKDLRTTAPDVVLHGGDLADNGSSPVEIVDRLRDLGWRGVLGNTDEMLFRPESMQDFAARSPKLQPLFDVVEEGAIATREKLGKERLDWLSRLPHREVVDGIALVHASPQTRWSAPAPEAPDDELRTIYNELGCRTVVYGHIHRAYIRKLPGLTVANAGSVGLPYDRDPRATYLLVNDGVPEIRRVEYDLDRELKLLSQSGLPHADWVARILRSSSPVLP